VRIRPHRVFRPDGLDLHADLPLIDYEAALGTRIRVPTLTGPVQLTVPPSTQPDQALRLKGQGLPATTGQAGGDLYFHVKIHTPGGLTSEERDLYEKIKRARGDRNEGESLRKKSFREGT
jgi:DnaJ-class molecular chaperone